jgi:hypothetical protein
MSPPSQYAGHDGRLGEIVGTWRPWPYCPFHHTNGKGKATHRPVVLLGPLSHITRNLCKPTWGWLVIETTTNPNAMTPFQILSLSFPYKRKPGGGGSELVCQSSVSIRSSLTIRSAGLDVMHQVMSKLKLTVHERYTGHILCYMGSHFALQSVYSVPQSM